MGKTLESLYYIAGVIVAIVAVLGLIHETPSSGNSITGSPNAIIINGNGSHNEDNYTLYKAINDQRTNVADTPITLSVSPNTGKQGTIFTFSGEGFTPNGAIEFHSKNQDGSDWFKTVTASSSGTFSYIDTTSTARAAGIYDIWAIDSATGKKSNYVQETITK
jgi:hypothetical protein